MARKVKYPEQVYVLIQNPDDEEDEFLQADKEIEGLDFENNESVEIGVYTLVKKIVVKKRIEISEGSL